MSAPAPAFATRAENTTIVAGLAAPSPQGPKPVPAFALAPQEETKTQEYQDQEVAIHVLAREFSPDVIDLVSSDEEDDEQAEDEEQEDEEQEDEEDQEQHGVQAWTQADDDAVEEAAWAWEAARQKRKRDWKAESDAQLAAQQKKVRC